MTVPGTQCRAHERIHPGLPAHLRHHGRTLLAVDFDRCERLGVPASAQPDHTGLPEGPDPSCFAEYRHQPVVSVEPEQLYRNGSAAFQEPQGAQRNAQVRHRASIAETRRTAHDGLVYVVVMTTSIRGKLCV
jgi:hypothetical protein